MNDPNKRIDVNISSLLSLKAELLRKQAEANVTKSTNTIENFVPKCAPKIEKSKKEKKLSNKKQDTPSENNTTVLEDSALLAKSRKILEMKSRFYDKMAKSGGALNSDENCLVMFNRKHQDEKPVEALSSDEEPNDDDDGDDDKYSSNNPEEDWVEYTDCLGRTRKCLRKDLQFFKKKDTALSVDIQPRQDSDVSAIPLPTEPPREASEGIESDPEDGEVVGPMPPPSLFPPESIETMAHREEMRLEWERRERENMNKEFIHYQDILFDEARTHGVGYYQFSTDAEERLKQRGDLDTIRESTLAEQKKREEVRKAREKIIEGRVRAAKNRQRARQGLPPLEDEPEPELKPTEDLYDTTEERTRKEEEELLKFEKALEENIRETERKNHVRPWDKGKIGAPVKGSDGDNHDEEDEVGEWKYKIERVPMTQDQWNTMKRAERPMEFAPHYIDVNPSPAFIRRNTQTETIPEPIVYEETNRSLFFTSKKKPPPSFEPQTSVPIQNELSESSGNDDDEDECSSSTLLRKGAAIPPPPTFDYYGPTSSKRIKTINKNPTKEKLEQSIEAGLKFLREQSDKNASSGGKRVWTTKLDY